MLDLSISLWHWIKDNAVVFSGLTSVGMLLIWGIYLQLLLHNFRMQLRPQLLINRGHGQDIDSLCIISNMSQQPVFIETIVAELETSRGTWFSDITDVINERGEESELSRDDAGANNPLSRVTHRGPLNQGEYMTSGTFSHMIRKINREHGLGLNDDYRNSDEDINLIAIEIHVVAMFSVFPHPIGALRRFEIHEHEVSERRLWADSHNTQQLGSWFDRRRLAQWRDSVR